MPNDIKIENKTNVAQNEKTKQQAKELEELKKQKIEADNKAKEKQIELDALKAKQDAQKKQAEEIAAVATSAIGAIGAATKKKGSLKNLLIGLVIGVIIGFLLATFLIKNPNIININNNETIDESFLTHTEVDFENVILGEVKQHQELIVMEQPIEVSTTITKQGLGNLEIFSKVKNVTYSGKGLYTVDMSKIDAEHIEVDDDNKVVKIIIPHTVLQEVVLDVNNIEFEDTEKGLLAFGDLALTVEQQNEIEVSVRSTMKQTLDDKQFYNQADEFASLKTWQIFQPLVTSVANEYVVEMAFE